MYYENEFRNKSSTVNHGEDEEVADGSTTIPPDFQKGGFPQSCEQGDNICQIK